MSFYFVPSVSFSYSAQTTGVCVCLCVYVCVLSLCFTSTGFLLRFALETQTAIKMGTVFFFLTASQPALLVHSVRDLFIRHLKKNVTWLFIYLFISYEALGKPLHKTIQGQNRSVNPENSSFPWLLLQTARHTLTRQPFQRWESSV